MKPNSEGEMRKKLEKQFFQNKHIDSLCIKKKKKKKT